MSTKIYGLK